MRKYKIISSYFFMLSIVSCASFTKNKAFYLDWPSSTRKISRHWSASHDGIDIILPSHSNIYAAHEGVVIIAGKSSSYGHYIILEFSDKWATLYAHLEKMFVQRGDKVQKKQQIATSGSTGKSTSPHLHFELMKTKYPVNPISYLKRK